MANVTIPINYKFAVLDANNYIAEYNPAAQFILSIIPKIDDLRDFVVYNIGSSTVETNFDGAKIKIFTKNTTNELTWKLISSCPSEGLDEEFFASQNKINEIKIGNDEPTTYSKFKQPLRIELSNATVNTKIILGLMPALSENIRLSVKEEVI